MSIYNSSGQILNVAYDADGNQISNAYDADGQQIFPDIDPSDYNFKIMSFNIQSWTGINAWGYIGSIFENYDVDVIGAQEAHTSSELTNLGYIYTAIGESPNSNIVFSKHQLSDITSKSYDVNHYAGKRGYQKMYITFNGKRIALFNTHLETSTATQWQYPQAGELFDAVSTENYFILTGDLNTVCANVNDPSYINIVKPFVDAGYNVANCSPQWGFVDTWTSGTDGTGTWHPCDNIITSANIQMSNVVIDTSKIAIAEANDLVIDHLPIIAYLKIT